MVHAWGSHRRGISLVEILMSIGVATIGLLGVATLIPVAQYAAMQGTRADRMTWVGRRALDEFRIRGLDNPLNWVSTPVTGDPTSTAAVPLSQVGELPGPDVTASAAQYIALVNGPRFGPISYPLDALLIDPLGAAFFGEQGNTQTRPFARTCPADANPKYPEINRLRRVTLRASNSGLGLLRQMPQVQARSIFELQDDLLFDIPTGDNLFPEPQFWAADNSGKTAVIKTANELVKKRFAEGRFSWLATLMPTRTSGDYLLSIAVIHDRDWNVEDAPGGGLRSAGERWAQVVSTTVNNAQHVVWAGGIGLQADPRDPTALDGLKSGQWMLVVQGFPRGNGVVSAKLPERYIRWYRIQAANHPAGSAVGEFTVDGPDWPVLANGVQANAIIFKNTIAVFEKTIRINSSGNWLDVGQVR